MKNPDYSKFWSPAFDTMDDFVFLIGRDFNVLEVNQSFLNFTKKDKKAVIGRKCHEIIHASNTPIDECPHKRMLETKKFEASEFYDANLKKWLCVRTTPIFDDANNLIGSIHLAADTTERKLSESRLREKEQKMRAIFDQTFEFIGLMTIGGVLIEANRAALDLVGIREADVLNKPFWETPWWTHSAELQAKLRDGVKKAAGGEFVRFEATHTAKDGVLHYVDFSLKPVKDDAGKIIFLIPEGRDITAFKKSEEALNYLAAIVESSDDAIIGKTLDGVITSWNGGAEKIYGYAGKEMIGKPVSMLVPPDRINELPQIYEKIRRGEHMKHFETVRMKKDGAQITVSLTVSPIKDIAGKIIGASTVARDITEHKKIDAELRKKIVELERFQKVTVDRELKMKELKTYIAELESKLSINNINKR